MSRNAVKAKTVKINEGFVCLHCQKKVPPAKKTCRNHCCHCLWSLHVDRIPGDRNCDCRGLMEPLCVENTKKGMVVILRCVVCGVCKRNRVANDDNWDKVIELSQFATQNYMEKFNL